MSNASHAGPKKMNDEWNMAAPLTFCEFEGQILDNRQSSVASIVGTQAFAKKKQKIKRSEGCQVHTGL